MDAVTLALMKSMAGGSSLPPVTDSDNGNVLSVQDGAWGKGIVRQEAISWSPINGITQYILVEYDHNTGFSTNITPKDVVEGYTFSHKGDTVVCPPLLNSVSTCMVIATADTGTPIYAGVLHLLDMDGVLATFSSEWMDLSSFSTDKIGFFTLEPSDGDEDPYNVVLHTYSYLPYVTASDNGSELIVENGYWMLQKKKFVVTLTPTALDYSGTMDKTVAEITAAYEAGQEIVFSLSDGTTRFDAPVNLVSIPDSGYPKFDATIVVTGDNSIINLTTNFAGGDSTSYRTTIYSLTPAS